MISPSETPYDRELTYRINPLNVTYLMQKLPHRFYVDARGETLELKVDLIAKHVIEKLHSHGCIIGIRYSDGGGNTFIETFITTSDGVIYTPDGRGGFIQNGLEYDILYMLLNPIELNNWMLQDNKFLGEIRGNTEENPRKHIPIHAELLQSIEKTRDRYSSLLLQNRK